jgi:hypothetical protein
MIPPVKVKYFKQILEAISKNINGEFLTLFSLSAFATLRETYKKSCKVAMTDEKYF